MDRANAFRGVRAFLPAILLGSFSAPAVSQTPANKSSIEGRVINALARDGLRRATLTLTATRGAGKPVTALSDENGRFAFGNLEPGGYRLTGERTGYQRWAYGARLNPASGRILVLTPGGTLGGLVFPLPPNAALSGAVLDQEGQPMPGLLVQALRNGYASGRLRWAPAGGVQTNDRGEFRIGGLPAGRYLLIATDMNIGIAIAGKSVEAPSGRAEEAYGSTYYGNTPDPARAVPVEIQAGDDRRGLQIQMGRSPTVRVRGKVIGAPDGSTLVMMLLRKGSTGGTTAPAGLGMAQQSDGSFEIRNAAPGSYLLTAISPTSPTRLAGALPVEVADRHIEGLEFHADSGRSLAGRVSMPGAEPAALQAVTVAIQSADFDWPEQPSASPSEDGRFTLSGVFHGRFRLRVTGLPENAYLQAVRLGGREADPDALEPAGSGELEIALSRGGAQVEGVVLGSDGQPLSGAFVALIPDSGRDSRYAGEAAAADGTFHLKGIAPGKYKVLAWEDLEPGAFRDPDFVKPFAERAPSLALEENGHSKLTVKVVGDK
jgi:hypothetical protein